MRVPRAAVVALALGLAACSSGSDEPKAEPEISEQHAEVGELTLEVVGDQLISPHQKIEPLDEGTRDKALAALQETFDATVVGPMTEGKAGSIDTVFTGDAVARAAGADRAVLYDEGLPAVERLIADKANVRLTALDGNDGKPALVVAKIDWDVRSADGDVRVQRIGELSLIPVFGTWLVGAYSVVTTRTVGGDTTTTTAASG